LVFKRNQAAISILKEVFAMSVTDYNARLYEKMKAEQDKYRGWLLHQEPSEILNHTYEYIVGHNDGNVYPNGLISRVEGVGKTAVMVTLESGSESIYATDTDSDGSSTHVLLGSGGADGLVETVETPRVLGVAVVCEGGGSAAVQSRVTALVQALTGIGTNHITVAKMASAN